MTLKNDIQPFVSETPQVGVITQWLDDKGYGWVKSGENRIFAHIKDFDRDQRRPRAGEEVRFIQGLDLQGRACAKRVTFTKIGKFPTDIGTWTLLFILLFLPLLALLWLPLPWWLGASGMLTVSIITYLTYANDKQRAFSKRWRVSEVSLHLIECIGGWPGAFLAQRRLRHKCSKLNYQIIFWTIVILYQFAAADIILNHQLSRALIKLFSKMILRLLESAFTG